MKRAWPRAIKAREAPARTKPSSPIFGMPVLAADKARTTIVFKRSFNPGFAGIENELFTRPSTMMVLGDAKKSVAALAHALKDEEHAAAA